MDREVGKGSSPCSTFRRQHRSEFSQINTVTASRAFLGESWEIRWSLACSHLSECCYVYFANTVTLTQESKWTKAIDWFSYTGISRPFRSLQPHVEGDHLSLCCGLLFVVCLPPQICPGKCFSADISLIQTVITWTMKHKDSRVGNAHYCTIHIVCQSGELNL